jgi:Glycosyl hydrolase family 26
MPLLPPRVRNSATRLVPRGLLSHPALVVSIACGLAVVSVVGLTLPVAHHHVGNTATAVVDRPSPSLPPADSSPKVTPPQQAHPRGAMPSQWPAFAGLFSLPPLPGVTPAPSAHGSSPPPFSVPPSSSSPVPPSSSSPVPTPPPPPPPPPAAHNAAWSGLGFFPGEGDGPVGAQKFRALEAWLGRNVPFVVSMTDTRDTQSFRSSVWGQFIQAGSRSLGAVTPRSVVSVPLSFGSLYPSAATGTAQFQAVVGGQYDDSYAYLGRALVNSGNGNAIIRLGWEFDGDWMPWSAFNNPQLYVAAYRHVHDLLRSISPGFLFDFCGNAGYRWPIPRGNSHIGWDAVYPGDAYVDIVGMDVYDDSSNWSYFHQVLTDHLAFAMAHGKPVSFPEWALDTKYGDNPAWVQNMLDWMDSLPRSGPGSLAYQSWFNGDNGNGRFSLDNFVQGTALFHSRMR